MRACDNAVDLSAASQCTSQTTLDRSAMPVITVRDRNDSIVFSIVAKLFFSVNTITHEPLH